MIAAAGGVFVTRFIWRYFIVFTARKLEFYLKDRLFCTICSFCPCDFTAATAPAI